jgi:hypothetical protein
MVPVLLRESSKGVDFLQDTTLAIEKLDASLKASQQVVPRTPVQQHFAHLVELMGDEARLKLEAMHYRWNYKKENALFVLQEFGRAVLPNMPSLFQTIAGLPFALLFNHATNEVLGVVPELHQPLESWYHDFLNAFEDHLKQYPYLLGHRPCIGDFGLLGPLYAHLARDPYPKKLMQEKAPRVYDWVQRMIQLPKQTLGDFVKDDAIPESLIPLLKLLLEDQTPLFHKCIEKVDDWFKNNKGYVVPRFIPGRQVFSVRGVESTRKIEPYIAWMFQRLQWSYINNNEEARGGIDSIHEKINAQDIFRCNIDHRLFYDDVAVHRYYDPQDKKYVGSQQQFIEQRLSLIDTILKDLEIQKETLESRRAAAEVGLAVTVDYHHCTTYLLGFLTAGFFLTFFEKSDQNNQSENPAAAMLITLGFVYILKNLFSYPLKTYAGPRLNQYYSDTKNPDQASISKNHRRRLLTMVRYLKMESLSSTELEVEGLRNISTEIEKALLLTDEPLSIAKTKEFLDLVKNHYSFLLNNKTNIVIKQSEFWQGDRAILKHAYSK